MRILPQASAWAPPELKAAPPLPALEHPLALDPSRLRLFGPGGKVLKFPTDGKVFNIGRDPANALQLDQECVSRHHAFGAVHGGQLFILDKSSLGTYIDGQKILPNMWTPVPDGASLELGGPQCRLNMGVGGSHTIMGRLDALKPDYDSHQLRMGDGSLVSVPEHGKSFKVGRTMDSELHMGDSSVSRYHADVKYEFGRMLVKDAGSTYGTFVNGKKLPIQEWVEVPEGGRVQFGQGAQSNLTLEPKAPLLITFFGDSSVPDIGGYVEAQSGGFEKALSSARSPAMVRGLIARGSLLKDAFYTALPALCGAEAGAGAVMVGAGLVLAAGGSAAGLGLAAVGVGVTGFGLWAAKETWHMMKGGYRSLKERLSRMSFKPGGWKHVQQEVVTAGPSIKQFKKLYAENMERYPTSRHVVFLSGHGDHKGAAGLKYAQVGQVVKGADAIFLDACNGAQLEALSHLSDSARVVVASEHTVQGTGFPLDRMFGRSNFPDQPRDLGAALVQSAARSMPSKSLVAVDVKVMKEELFPAMDRLGSWLGQAVDKGWGKELKKALEESQSPSNGPGGFGKKVDLGSFLNKLAHIGPLWSASLGETQAAFDKTILSMSGSGTVSFAAGGSKELPPEFNAFLKRL